MSDLRIRRSQESGVLIIERDFVVEDRIGVRVDIFYRPKGFWRKLRYVLGSYFPGPTAVEIETGGQIIYSDSRRQMLGFSVVERSYNVMQRGKGVVRLALNPDDFYRHWSVSMALKELNN